MTTSQTLALLRSLVFLCLLGIANAQPVPGMQTTGINPGGAVYEFFATGADYTSTPDGTTGDCAFGLPGMAAPFPGMVWMRLGPNLFVFVNNEPLAVIWNFFDWNFSRGTVTYPNGSPGGTWWRI